MVFTSPIFVFGFLPALILIYFFANERYRNGVLLLFSLFFYSFGEPKNILIMLFSIGINYFAGRAIERGGKRKKGYFILTILIDLLLLFMFKYFNFSVNLLNAMTGVGLKVREIALPIGISFYTFQIMSYTIDVYRGECKAQQNIWDLALYVSLFPQLIAGPIVRYVDIEREITERQVTVDGLYRGFLRFAVGFSRKVLIADQLAPLVDRAFSDVNASWQLNWIGIIAYALQIYYDFSGYSDMAIGMGEIFGFHFLENFNEPYVSKSIREFWRRWHISLGTWFRDYLYIPLGGNRKGKIRTYVNLLIVFATTGLWHGASLNFLVWGLYYGFFLILERVGLDRFLQKMPGIMQHAYSLLVILIGWVFFRTDNLGCAFQYIAGMFAGQGMSWNELRFFVDEQDMFCIIAGILFAGGPICEGIRRIEKRGGILYPMLVFILFVIALCYMAGSGFSPFLYFRF